jgi:hypothetical protein
MVAMSPPLALQLTPHSLAIMTMLLLQTVAVSETHAPVVVAALSVAAV